MSTRIKRRFELDDLRVEIEEILTQEVSGKTKHHGTHLWPSSVVLAAAIHKLDIARQRDKKIKKFAI